MPYDLNNPPEFAELKIHAKTICANAFTVAHRTMGDRPIDMPMMNGKRQPATVEVWAYVIALAPTEARSAILGRMGDYFRAEVEARHPAAMEAKRIADDRKKRKAGPGGGMGRGAHRKAAGPVLTA